MAFDLVTYVESCVAVIEQNADFVKLIYYSHLPVSIIALLFGTFVFTRDRKNPLNQALFGIALSFAVWSLLDLVSWMGTDSRWIMFAWSLLGLVNSLIFIASLLFVYAFIHKREIPNSAKLLLGLGLLPLILFTPTHWDLTAFDASSCLALEGSYFLGYYYFFDALLFLAILVMEVIGYKKHTGENRKQILILSCGINLFLVSFFVTGYLASILEYFELVVYGLFGMAFFLAFLTYIIVKYQAFNLKLLGTQALVVGLISLIGSQLFFTRELINYILVGITFALAGGFGIVLIRSVKEEVKQKEKLQVLANELAAANAELKRLDTAKSEFISIASHQLRTPLTAIRGFLSLLLEGAYGKLEPKIGETINKIVIANNRLMSLVENLLNISRIEAGRIQYQFAPTHIEDIVGELDDMFALAAKEKGLLFKVEKPAKPLPVLSLDANKIREVISNMIDNAMKYTQKGSITVSFERHPECVAVMIKDTGMGIDPNDLPHLFKKFERGSQAERVNVSSTGLGLYVGRKFAEAHGGTITAHSEGKGKGSTFVLELPIHVVERVKQLSQH